MKKLNIYKLSGIPRANQKIKRGRFVLLPVKYRETYFELPLWHAWVFGIFFEI